MAYSFIFTHLIHIAEKNSLMLSTRYAIVKVIIGLAYTKNEEGIHDYTDLVMPEKVFIWEGIYLIVGLTQDKIEPFYLIRIQNSLYIFVYEGESH